MQTMNAAECADLMSQWLMGVSTGKDAEEVAKEIRYKTPIFGAKEKRRKLFVELVLVNTAIAIHGAHTVFTANFAKEVIAKFSFFLADKVYPTVGKGDPGFKILHRERIPQYLKALSSDQPGIGLSFAFMSNLGLDPLDNLASQLAVAARFGASYKEILDSLRSSGVPAVNTPVSFGINWDGLPKPKNSATFAVVQRAEAVIATWPLDDQIAGLGALRYLLGDTDMPLDTWLSLLSQDKLKVIGLLMEDLSGSELG